MKFIEKLRQVERVDQLIRLKGTGTPKELAYRLEVSEGSIYNLIDIIRSLGGDVYFCEQQKSYCYGERRLQFVFKTINNIDNIVAGKTFLENFSSLQNFCSSPLYLCTVTLQ